MKILKNWPVLWCCSDVEDTNGFGEDDVAKNNFDEWDDVNKQFRRTDQFCGVAEDKDKADRE